ncbi:MAG: MMPL family transporter [Rhodobacterales bacterium]|nr:MMPL family transporter [Rhodobacterales bacterium]
MRFPAHWVVDRPWLFIVLFAVLTLGMATRLPGIQIDPEVKNQLPADMEGRLNINAIEDVFGGTEMLMIVMEADDILAPNTLKRLKSISKDLQEIEAIDRVMGLFTLQDITGEDGMMVVESAVENIPKTDEDRAELAARLQANDFVYGNVVSKDFTAAATIALLATDSSDDEMTAAVQVVLDNNPGAEAVFVGGMPQVRVSVSRDIRADMRRFAPLGLLILLRFLYACFRQIRAVLLPFLVVVMSITVAMGFIPVFGWKMQMVTVILPVILLAVANDYGIHLLAKYQEENIDGKDRSPQALATRVLEDLGGPVLAAGLTTMAGLLCLTTHVVVPAQQLGVLAAIGVGFALLASIGFIPAMLTVLPPTAPLPALAEGSEGGVLQRGLAQLAETVIARPKAWIAGLLLVSAIAISGIVFLEVDTNPVNYYESTAPVAQISMKINRHFGGSTELAVMVEGDIQDPEVLRGIDALETELKSLPQVGYTTSIAGIVRTMNQAVMGGGKDENKLPDSREAVAQYFLLYSMGGDPEDFERIVDFDYAHTQVTARINSLGTDDIALVVAAAEAHLAAHPIGEKTTVAGFGPLFVDLVDAVVDGQVISLLLSLALVFVLISITFKSPAAGMWSVVPLAIAIPVLFGLMGYWSIELNIVTAMLSSIMIGVGVDYTIHFLWRYRALRRQGDNAEDGIRNTLTSTGRGIVFNALSVIAGFGVLLISNFLPVKFFGFLVVVSISACLIGALVLLPAICLVLRPKFLEP